MDSVGEGEVGWFERIALKHVYYHMWNRSPVQVWCMRQGAQGLCTGMTLRDGMGREVGWVSRMGNICTSMVDSCQYMPKPPQYCKVISLQLNKEGKKMNQQRWYIHTNTLTSGILFSHAKEENYGICFSTMEELGEHYVKWNMPE